MATYETILAIGAKLQSSFGSTFAAVSKEFDTVKSAAKGFQETVGGALSKVGGMLTSIPAQLAGLGAGVGFVEMGKHAIDLASNMEQLGTAMEVHLKSPVAAQELIKDIQAFAKESASFNFPDLAHASKQMLAYGFSAKQVIPELKTLTDVASGLGIPIQDLTYLYGTLKVQGRAMTKDIQQFTNRGIPMWEALAETMSKTGEAYTIGKGKNAYEVTGDQIKKVGVIQELVTAGAVKFEETQKAFQYMTSEQGKFFEMGAKQGETFAGRMNTMADTINQALTQIGKPLVEGLGPILDSINKSPFWTEIVDKINSTIVPAIQSFVAALQGDLGGAILKLGQDFGGMASAAGEAVAKMFGGFTDGKVDAIQTVTNIVLTLGNTFKFLGDNMAIVAPIIATVAGAFVAMQIVGSIAAGVQAFAVAIGAAQAAMVIFNAVMLANPIGLVATAIAALVVGIGLLIANWDKVTAAATGAFEAMMKVLGLSKQTPQDIEASKAFAASKAAMGGRVDLAPKASNYLNEADYQKALDLYNKRAPVNKLPGPLDKAVEAAKIAAPEVTKTAEAVAPIAKAITPVTATPLLLVHRLILSS